jgi:hypothetical protein
LRIYEDQVIRFLAAALALLVAACSAELDWREFSWPEGGFAVVLPAKPAMQQREVRIGARVLQMTMFPVQLEGLAFGVGYADLPAGWDAAERAALLVDARDQLAANLKASPTNEQAIKLGRFPGRHFMVTGEADGKPMHLVARVYVTDRRFYQQVFVGTQARAQSVDLTPFLDSLKLLP